MNLIKKISEIEMLSNVSFDVKKLEDFRLQETYFPKRERVDDILISNFSMT